MLFKNYLLLFIFLFFSIFSSAQENHQSHSSKKGMVVTAHFMASKVGVEILKEGGNAFDAAVAVQFALAVVYPRAGNIGGGGFAVIRTSEGKYNSLDFREKAPMAATKNMYLDSLGNVIQGLSQESDLAVGVPGSVDGMYQLHKKYGSLSWEILLQPAISLADKGVVLTEAEAAKLNDYREKIWNANPSKTPCCYIRKEKFKKGEKLVNPDLKNTLIRIQKYGREGFYQGTTANLLVEEMKRGNGLITLEDLANYHAIWREALTGNYRDCKIITMPPPSSGGVALIQLLKGAEMFDMGQYQFGSFEHIHLMTELERRVYADRATWLGDPDYYSVPSHRLIGNKYLKDRFSDIKLNAKSNSQDIKAGSVEVIESFETTHYSIVDSFGNAIAVTTTLNGNYGCKTIVGGAGFFLNNEMDDFSIKPGFPNQFGLVGGKANSIQPEKRMLSSMTPTIVEKSGKLYMLVGSPGGSTIITSVFQNIINAVEFHLSPRRCVDAPRVHSQWLPDVIYAEPNAISPKVKQELEAIGHRIQLQNKIGTMANIFLTEEGYFIGVADDNRHHDAKAEGY